MVLWHILCYDFCTCRIVTFNNIFSQWYYYFYLKDLSTTGKNRQETLSVTYKKVVSLSNWERFLVFMHTEVKGNSVTQHSPLALPANVH